VSEQFAQVGDVELCYETFGDPSDPPLLLVMGLGAQMIAWNDDFVAELVGRGFYVIRFDNRDCGRSTKLSHVRPPGPRELVTRRVGPVAYTLSDMAADAAGLLDHLGIGSAHLVGASMGGMIAQTLAAEHPHRVRSLASIMSTTGGLFVGRPAYRAYPFLLKRAPNEREAFVERAVQLFRIVGSTGFERSEDDLRDMIGRSFDRGISAAGTGRQLAAIIASGNRTPALRRIKAPTVVIHGSVDKLVGPSGGRATARAIPNARLELVKGMGHDLPRGAWPRLLDAIELNAARASEPAEARAA
jgi:pimeloyl-ACP methyl ester carboxylesterase